jgi:hypothetical protein
VRGVGGRFLAETTVAAERNARSSAPWLTAAAASQLSRLAWSSFVLWTGTTAFLVYLPSLVFSFGGLPFGLVAAGGVIALISAALGASVCSLRGRYAAALGVMVALSVPASEALRPFVHSGGRTPSAAVQNLTRVLPRTLVARGKCRVRDVHAHHVLAQAACSAGDRVRRLIVTSYSSLAAIDSEFRRLRAHIDHANESLSEGRWWFDKRHIIGRWLQYQRGSQIAKYWVDRRSRTLWFAYRRDASERKLEQGWSQVIADS